MVEVFNTAVDLHERGYALRDAPFNLACYDSSGDGDDRDALVLLSREEWRRGELHDPDLSVEFIFRVLLAHRMPLDIEYPEKISQLLALNRQLNVWKRQGKSAGHCFTVETNGVGYGLAGALGEKLACPVIRYTTVGNTSDKPSIENRIAMPRLAALDHLRLMMELHRLKLVKGAPGAEALVEELNAFVWRRRGRPEAMKGAKDDLVMALTGGVWIGSKIIPPMTKQKTFPGTPGRATHSTGRMRVQ